jgi:hypothetical protein
VKYMLLIHQGDTPHPGTPEWEPLSAEEQQAVYRDYQAINVDRESTKTTDLQAFSHSRTAWLSHVNIPGSRDRPRRCRRPPMTAPAERACRLSRRGNRYARATVLMLQMRRTTRGRRALQARH